MLNRCLHLMEGGNWIADVVSVTPSTVRYHYPTKKKVTRYKVVVCARKEFISETAAKSMRNGMHIDRRQQFIFP